MKFRLLALLLAATLLLCACTTPADPTTEPPVSTTAPAEQEPTVAPTQPTEGEEEALDVFGALFPKDGTIPRGKDLTEYVKLLADNTTRISQINYTWINGRPSMEVLAGTYDEFYTYEKPEENPMQLIYDESEYYDNENH